MSKLIPKVSVIVPNYNHSSFLKKRLDSILDQTFQDFEIILLDDASTDVSVSILKNYSNYSKVSHFHINEKNSGSPFIQWNKGFNLAKGEYIWIAESDDWANPEILSECVSVLDQHPNVGLVTTCSFVTDENGKTILSTFDWLRNSGFPIVRSEILIQNGESFVLKYQLDKTLLYNASSIVFRKKFTQNPPELFFKVKQTGDTVFWTHILLNSDIAYLGIELNYLRRSQNAFTIKNQKIESLIPIERLEIINYIKNSITSKNNPTLNKMVQNAVFLIFLKWLKAKRAKKIHFSLNDFLFLFKITTYFPKVLLTIFSKKTFHRVISWGLQKRKQ